METENSHECYWKKGKITDVTFDDLHIYCNKCGKELKETHVNPKDLAEIKMMWARRKDRRNN
jgi:hypothetical protein